MDCNLAIEALAAISLAVGSSSSNSSFNESSCFLKIAVFSNSLFNSDWFYISSGVADASVSSATMNSLMYSLASDFFIVKNILL